MNLFFSLQHSYQTMATMLTKFVEPLALFAMRITVGHVFLSSGLVKWDGLFRFNVDTYDLFLYEFFCPEEVRPGALLLCNPDTLEYVDGSFTVKIVELLALSAGIMEVLLALLLIVGLFSRFAALGLLAMTLFIQLAVFPTWSHWVNPASWWAVTSFVLLARGPGWLSLDRVLKLDR